LSSGKFAETLAGAGDVIKLAIFGHTHEDEIELLQDEAASRQETSGERDGDIPVKIVPSISPVNGNEPSFTVAQVDAGSAMLLDYQVIAGGPGKPWAETYDFAKAYGTDSFSADSVAGLMEKFAADPNGKSHDSREYIHNFLTGSNLPLLSLVWPQYVCTLAHQSAEGFTACACKGR
jgi:sphingomyelin phosphodiesterase acid-like 3